MRWMLGVALLLASACNGSPSGGDSAPGDAPGLRDGSRPEASPGDGPASGETRPGDGTKPTPDLGKKPDGAPPATECAALPAPTGTTVKVTPAQAAGLPGIVASAKSGTTILLEDGSYTMKGSESQRRLSFAVAGVTLRSASGDRTKVVIDGEYQTSEIVFVSASDVTIAHLTIKRAVDHLIHVTGAPGNVKNTRLHDLLLIDSGEQFVKVNGDGKGNWADGGRLECSTLELTAAGRPKVEPNPGGCYTGGIDGHGAWGWQVRLNTFKGIYCDGAGLAEHAIHFWTGSRDTLVERNRILSCARGIGFGLGQSGAARTYSPDPYPSVAYKGHIDGIIRANLIHVEPAVAKYHDTGIGLEQAHGVRVYHNTLVSKPTFSSIDYRFSGTKAEIRNNLTFKITLRDGAQGSVDHNLENAPASLFVNAAGADYHLAAGASAAIDKGVVVPEAGLDLDGKAHDVGAPDLGALERRP
jgi:hypothetical protein